MTWNLKRNLKDLTIPGIQFILSVGERSHLVGLMFSKEIVVVLTALVTK
jgi:hypothetical protein